MKILENTLYKEDISTIADLNLPWKKLDNKSILISGATGMIGSFLIDVLMKRNVLYNSNCHVYALGRNTERAKERFSIYWNDSHFHFISHDITKSFLSNSFSSLDYILHLASNTHPLQYAQDPIGTITTNMYGLKNLLDLASTSLCERVLFASSVEVYGENRGDTELFREQYCGYIDCNTLRAGYPESKRCGEALCQAYIRQKDLDVVIARLARTYGPTMLMADTKASSQFIKNGIAGQDIVLKSSGMQYYSYTYVADAVSGLLYTLLLGEKGEAYNIADESSDIRLKDFAGNVAEYCGTKVIFDEPDKIEKTGYSAATKARMDGSKLRSLGWKPNYTIRNGIERTIIILEEY